MKGMLVKDFRLLQSQKLFLYMMLLIAIILSFTMEDGSSFMIGYFTFIGATLVSSSISYDEYANGMAALLTLPITKQEYIYEKYLLGMITAVLSWMIAMFISIASLISKQQTVDLISCFENGFPVLLLSLLFISIMIPVQIRFGVRKSYVAMIVVMVLAVVAGYLIYLAMTHCGIYIDDIMEQLCTNNTIAFYFIFLLITSTGLLTSLFITLRIINNKDY